MPNHYWTRFGLLETLFRRLLRFDNLDIKIIVQCVLAACILYNVRLQSLDDDDGNTLDLQSDVAADDFANSDIIIDRRQDVFHKMFIWSKQGKEQRITYWKSHLKLYSQLPMRWIIQFCWPRESNDNYIRGKTILSSNKIQSSSWLCSFKWPRYMVYTNHSRWWAWDVWTILGYSSLYWRWS